MSEVVPGNWAGAIARPSKSAVWAKSVTPIKLPIVWMPALRLHLTAPSSGLWFEEQEPWRDTQS